MRDEQPKVIGLIRVSTKEQAEDAHAGIARQREIVTRTIETKKLNCEEIIELSDVSGANVRKCPEIRRLLSLVQSRKVEGVVVADLDRLLRPAGFEDFALLQVFQDSGATLYCGDQEIDLSSDSGYLMGGFQALMAGNELRMFKRRVQGAKEEKRKQGKCPSAAITWPKGVAYDRQREQWMYTTEIAAVQEAFRLVDEDVVTNYCELERRTGIHHRTLHNLLRNPIYAGQKVYAQKRGEKYTRKDGRQADRRKVNRAPDEIINVKVIREPAIDPSRFARVQEILGGKRTTWASSRSTPSSRLLTGVGRCSECKSVLYCSASGGKKRRKPGYYICRRNYYLYREESGGCPMRNIRQDVTDDMVARWISERLSERSVVKGILSHYESTQASDTVGSQDKIVDVEKTLAALEQKRHRLNQGYVAGRFSDEEHTRLKAELDAEDRMLGAMKAKEPLPSMEEGIERRLLLLAKGALAFARITDRLKQKVVIQQMFAEIHVGNDGIKGFRIRPQFDAHVCEDGSRTGMGSWQPSA